MSYSLVSMIQIMVSLTLGTALALIPQRAISREASMNLESPMPVILNKIHI